MDLLQKIDMFIGEDYNRPDTRYGKPSKDSVIAKKVKQHNTSVKYGKKGTLTRPPEGYVKDNKGMYHKVSDDDWKKKRLGEGSDEGKSFPAKKKSDDKSSEESASDAEKKLSDLEKAEAAQDDEGSMSPEEIKAKEKKQKELKKEADRKEHYTPPYAAV